MGRFDDIIARNRKPPKRRERIELGLRSIFLLVILGLLLFTSWAIPPEDKKPAPVEPALQPAPQQRKIPGAMVVVPERQPR